MLELPHTAVGAFIAYKIPNPLISLPLAFLSHLVLDEIPHWNPNIFSETKQYGHPLAKTTIIVFLDVALSLILGFYFAFKVLPDIGHALTIIAASFLAISWDAIEGLHFYFGVRKKSLKRLINFQRKHQSRSSIIPGILTQVAVVALILYLTLSR